MKKTVRNLVLTLLVLCLAQAAALAADSVSVQINGENVAFSDAAPQVVGERTFLPARAVFEQMGAEVSYDNGVVTAVRDGRTIILTIGSTDASVTENGETRTLELEAAPYIDPALGRTYIPAGFAAEAMGTSAGWDEDSRTVLILDAEKEFESLLADRSFTNLDQLIAYSRKYNTGIWQSELTMNGTVKVDMSEPEEGLTLAFTVPVSVTARGATQDASKLDTSFRVTADLSSVKSLLAQDVDEEEAALFDTLIPALAKGGISCAIRGDMAAGKLYCKPDLSALGELASMAGIQTDTWYLLEMADVYEENGVDYNEMMSWTQKLDTESFLKLAFLPALNSASLENRESFAELDSLLRQIVDAISDSSFTRSGDVSAAEWKYEEDGVAAQAVLTLTMKDEAVAGYALGASLSADTDALGAIELGAQTAVDEQDVLTGSMTLNVGTLVQASFDMTGSYTQGGEAPVTEPPAGAAVENLLDLAG